MQNICKVCICFVIEFTIIASSFFCYGFLVLFYWWRKQNRHCDYWTQWNWINVFLGGHWDGIAERTSYIFGLSLNEGETIRETHTYTSESIDSLLLFCMFTKCAYIIYFNLQERIVNPNWNKCTRPTETTHSQWALEALDCNTTAARKYCRCYLFFPFK